MAPPADPPPIVILRFNRATGRSPASSLRGFFDLQIPRWHLRLSGCTLNASHGKYWIGLPSRPLIDRDGHALRDDAGKIRYEPIITFTDNDRRNRFTEATLAAIAAHDPTLFEPALPALN
jgi:hypothetical protein